MSYNTLSGPVEKSLKELDTGNKKKWLNLPQVQQEKKKRTYVALLLNRIPFLCSISPQMNLWMSSFIWLHCSLNSLILQRRVQRAPLGIWSFCWMIVVITLGDMIVGGILDKTIWANSDLSISLISTRALFCLDSSSCEGRLGEVWKTWVFLGIVVLSS